MADEELMRITNMIEPKLSLEGGSLFAIFKSAHINLWTLMRGDWNETKKKHLTTLLKQVWPLKYTHQFAITCHDELVKLYGSWDWDRPIDPVDMSTNTKQFQVSFCEAKEFLYQYRTRDGTILNDSNTPITTDQITKIKCNVIKIEQTQLEAPQLIAIESALYAELSCHQ